MIRSLYFGVSQTITTAAGQSYTLSVALGVDNSNSRYSGPISVNATVGPVATAHDVYNPIATANLWQVFDVNFTANSSSMLISLQGDFNISGWTRSRSTGSHRPFPSPRPGDDDHGLRRHRCDDVSPSKECNARVLIESKLNRDRHSGGLVVCPSVRTFQVA
jgi:hypothetical protein